MLIMHSRSARPIVAFARQPCPNRLWPLLMSSVVRAGPLTTSITPVGLVVPWTP
jgi:hypothetical protein